MQRQATPPLLRARPAGRGVRLAVLVILALALLIVDSSCACSNRCGAPCRWRCILPARRHMPRDLVQQVDEWINAASLIRSENEALQRQRIELAQVARTRRSWPPRMPSGVCWA